MDSSIVPDTLTASKGSVCICRKDFWMGQPDRFDAIYRLETPVKCPHCGETVTSLRAVRLLRDQVNFTSTLPRRGRVVACPNCQAILPAELTNL